MEMRRSLCLLSCIFPLLAGPSRAQFTARDLAQRPDWEAFLREAEIVGQEKMSFEQGVTEAWKLTLRQGGVVRRAIFKDAMGVRGGYLEGWRFEIAAYVVDKLLDLGMVPPTVRRVWEGRPGSCQLWIEGTALLRDLAKEPENQESLSSRAWKDVGFIGQFFDNLIGNEDRHQGNVLVTRNFRGILIDHSRTFRVGKSFIEGIPFSETNVPAEELMRRLPRALVERAESLSEQDLRDALSDLLTEAEIQAIVARQRIQIGRAHV